MPDDTQTPPGRYRGGGVEIPLDQIYQENLRHGNMLQAISTQLEGITTILTEMRTTIKEQEARISHMESDMREVRKRELDDGQRKILEAMIELHTNQLTDKKTLDRGTRWTLWLMAAALVVSSIVVPLIGHFVK